MRAEQENVKFSEPSHKPFLLTSCVILSLLSDLTTHFILIMSKWTF